MFSASVNQGFQNNTSDEEADTEKLSLSSLYTSFAMLIDVNKNNLALLQEIFSSPTPHLTIPGRRITEGLFGGNPGSFPGSIESSGHGNKIVINRIIGFYNFQHPEKEFHLKPIRGSAWEIHQPGKAERNLPRVTVEMIRSTLERAGITSENLHLFCEAKDKLAASKKSADSNKMRMTLDIAETLLQEKRKVHFLFGLDRRLGKRSLFAKTFGILEAEKDQEALSNILSFM